MKVPFQVRLIAYQLNGDGTQSIIDVVETSYHYAYHFTRKWMRDTAICRFTAEKPPKED